MTTKVKYPFIEKEYKNMTSKNKIILTADAGLKDKIEEIIEHLEIAKGVYRLIIIQYQDYKQKKLLRYNEQRRKKREDAENKIKSVNDIIEILRRRMKEKNENPINYERKQKVYKGES